MIPPTISTFTNQPTPHSQPKNYPTQKPAPFHTKLPIHTPHSSHTQYKNPTSNRRNHSTKHSSKPNTKTHKHYRIDVKHNSLRHYAYKHKVNPQHKLLPHPHQGTPDSNMTTPHTYISTHKQYTSIASKRYAQPLNNQRLKATHYTQHPTTSYPNPPSQSIHNRIQTTYFNNRHINPTRHLSQTSQHFKHVKSGKKAPPKIFQKHRPPYLGQFYTQSKTPVKSPHAQKYIDSEEMKVSELHKLADDSFSAFSDNPITTKRKPNQTCPHTTTTQTRSPLASHNHDVPH
jgi:hypothetical protein